MGRVDRACRRIRAGLAKKGRRSLLFDPAEPSIPPRTPRLVPGGHAILSGGPATVGISRHTRRRTEEVESAGLALDELAGSLLTSLLPIVGPGKRKQLRSRVLSYGALLIECVVNRGDETARRI